MTLLNPKNIFTDNMQITILYVNMKNVLENAGLLQALSNLVQGVFTLPELSSLFNISDFQKLQALIRQFVNAGLLTRYCRGVYVTKGFDIKVLSAKVRPDSYVTFGSALAAHKLIGTESPFMVSCAVPSRAAEYTGNTNLSYSRISQDLYFGFEPNEYGVKIATPEKAVLDTFYFYQHGKNFYFNIFQDIQFSALSKKKMETYLEKYNNPKFQSFVRNNIYGKL